MSKAESDSTIIPFPTITAVAGLPQAETEAEARAVLFGAIPGMTDEMFGLGFECEPEWMLTFAVNMLRATWLRHPGGLLNEHDRNALLLAIILCRRALIEGLPEQAGGIGGRTITGSWS